MQPSTLTKIIRHVFRLCKELQLTHQSLRMSQFASRTPISPLADSVASILDPTREGADNLKRATIYTRFAINGTTKCLTEGLRETPVLKNTFLLPHLNKILVFDNDPKVHAEHMEAIEQAFRDWWFRCRSGSCRRSTNWRDAGFRIDELGGTKPRFMVILR